MPHLFVAVIRFHSMNMAAGRDRSGSESSVKQHPQRPRSCPDFDEESTDDVTHSSDINRHDVNSEHVIGSTGRAGDVSDMQEKVGKRSCFHGAKMLLVFFV